MGYRLTHEQKKITFTHDPVGEILYLYETAVNENHGFLKEIYNTRIHRINE